MSTDLPDFPKRLPEKLKTIRERLAMTPDQIAAFVGAKNGAEIVAYENDEDDMLISVLWGYARLSGSAGINSDSVIFESRQRLRHQRWWQGKEQEHGCDGDGGFHSSSTSSTNVIGESDFSF